MIYCHSDDGAWWTSGGSRAHLALIRFTWVPTDPHAPHLSLGINVRSIHLPVDLLAKLLFHFLLELRLHTGMGFLSPFLGCWWSGSLPAIPLITTAFAPRNETLRLWFPLDTSASMHKTRSERMVPLQSLRFLKLCCTQCCSSPRPLFGRNLPCVSFSFSFGSVVLEKWADWHLEDKFCVWEAQWNWTGIHTWRFVFYYEVQSKFGETDERRVGLHSKSLLNAKYTESGPRENDFSILVDGKNSNT